MPAKSEALFQQFLDAPHEYTVVPFWFLNDDLDETELKRQIDDFHDHGVYGFIPHARLGLAERIGFMSDAWLHYTKVCVDHAAAKGMYVILYDEGMYPSGSCAGKVVAENPRYATRCLERRHRAELTGDEELVAEDGRYAYVNARSMGHIRGPHFGQDDKDPGAPPSGDLLSHEAMACFRRLVLDGHYEALKEHFGKTVVAVFTDEPDVMGRGHKKDTKPWTWGFESFLKEYLGYDFVPHLAALWDDGHPDADRLRRDFTRAVNERLEQTYYAPYHQWCVEHGIALTGHPAGPDDIGMLRHFDWPGQDIVWRYIEPYQDKSIEGDQSTMGKCSSSAQRHFGRKRNINECFGAYGWEFTYDEMRYITDWLFARGVNLIIPHAFYYSLRDKRRDERPPDVGPNSPWWPEYKAYADYCRRMSWLIAESRHVCHFAILGNRDRLPWRAARAMYESQHDFNYLDTETLLRECQVEPDGIRIQDMFYRALIVDGANYADDATIATLKPLTDSGRVLSFGDQLEWTPRHTRDAAELGRLLDVIQFPDVTTNPTTPWLRCLHVAHAESHAYLFTNEGQELIDVDVFVSADGPRAWWDPFAAEILGSQDPKRLVLPPLASRILVT